MVPGITVVIHTYNEENNIGDCIKSARRISKRIAVIDMQSTDKTVEIAGKLSAKTYTFPLSHYVEPAREFGIGKAETAWVMIIDADERITPDLAAEVKKAVLNPRYTHYKIPRKNIFGRIKWLSHGGWWPDSQTRLIGKKYFSVWPKRIHSSPKISGKRGFLKNPIVHLFHSDIAAMVEKTAVFENIESDLLHKAGRQASVPVFFRKFSAELYRRLFKNSGYLDGPFGIIESIYQAFSKTITYIYLYEKNI